MTVDLTPFDSTTKNSVPALLTMIRFSTNPHVRSAAKTVLSNAFNHLYDSPSAENGLAMITILIAAAELEEADWLVN